MVKKPSFWAEHRQLLIMAATLSLLIVGTIGVVLYGRGYRIGQEGGKLDLLGTGMLVATSSPDGAQVYVNDHLTTATDDTINLAPGTYKVRISKEGYFSWEKEIEIQEEVVSKADALLFPTTPKLEGITVNGVSNPALDPTQTRLAYTVSSQSARKNGIYVLDMSSRPVLTLQSASIQVADNTIDEFSTAYLTWSPDGQELLATLSSNFRIPTTYLLSASELNEAPQDVTPTLYGVSSQWATEQQEESRVALAALKKSLQAQVASKFEILSFSPDHSKILYKASDSAELPLIIKPRLIGTNPTREDRSLQKDSIYVYDIKEDRNYKISDSIPLPESYHPLALTWFSDSAHLIHVHDGKIDILEYDGKNPTTVYAGPFVDNYVYPWPNGSKLVILTNLGNPNIAPNLYTIGLK